MICVLHNVNKKYIAISSSLPYYSQLLKTQTAINVHGEKQWVKNRTICSRVYLFPDYLEV